VIYVMDAHESLEAQENIAAMIALWVRRRGLRQVYEEGYEGPLPTEKYFGRITDRRIRERVTVQIPSCRTRKQIRVAACP